MILNLTQHPATPEQIAAGVVEPASKAAIQECLTFKEIPRQEEIFERAETLAQYALQSGCNSAMIGGAGYLMRPLETALIRYNIRPLHSFTQRESVETVQADGTIKKTAIFKHIGFVGADREECNNQTMRRLAAMPGD